MFFTLRTWLDFLQISYLKRSERYRMVLSVSLVQSNINQCLHVYFVNGINNKKKTNKILTIKKANK